MGYHLGLVTPTPEELKRCPHNFTLTLDQIDSAVLQMPKRPGAVARLNIEPAGMKPIRLTINSPKDLQMVHDEVLPALGQRGRITGE